MLAGIQGRFILSINDARDVRRIFAEFKIRGVTTTYSTSNGRGANNGRAKARSELIIRNF